MKKSKDKNSPAETSTVSRVMKRVLEHGMQGVGPLKSAEELALAYKKDKRYRSPDERARALIKWESSKSFGIGAITGLGGAVTLPVSIPSSMYATWVLQARMAGAIACLYGHSIESDRVRAFILMAILGDAGKDVLKKSGVEISKKVAGKALRELPQAVIHEMYRRAGIRLFARAGETWGLRLMKLVPLAGGIVGGLFDSLACYAAGRAAQSLFRTKSGDDHKGAPYSLRITETQLNGIARELSPRIRSLSLPRDDCLAVRFRRIPFTLRFTLTGFEDGLLKLRCTANPVLRPIAGASIRRHIRELRRELGEVVEWRKSFLTIRIDELVVRYLRLRSIGVSDISIHRGEIRVVLN